MNKLILTIYFFNSSSYSWNNLWMRQCVSSLLEALSLPIVHSVADIFDVRCPSRI